MDAPRPSAIRRRQITAADLPAVTDLLTEGFPVRDREYWRGGLEILARREAPQGYPRFGHILEAQGEPVGVIILIFSHQDGDPAAPVQCNLSSWYVREAYRAWAGLLTAAAMSLKEVTYINASPAGYTWSILDSQGYRRYAEGQFVSLPSLSLRGTGMRVRRVRPGAPPPDLPEAELLAAHAEAGCLSLVCETAEGPLPFVFIRWRPASRLRMARLLWCRDTADYVACAGPLGRWLLTRGLAAVALDATAPVAGLPGRWFPGAEPKYYRGPRAPRLNDLAFTEQVVFGV